MKGVVICWSHTELKVRSRKRKTSASPWLRLLKPTHCTMPPILSPGLDACQELLNDVFKVLQKEKTAKGSQQLAEAAGAAAYVGAFVFQLTITFFLTKLQFSVSEKKYYPQAKPVQMVKSGGCAPSYQISYSQDVFKLWRHRMVLHCHKQGVKDDADGDGQIHERVHNNQVHNLLQLYPVGVTFPDEDSVGKFRPAWRALPLRLFQLCSKSRTKGAPQSWEGNERVRLGWSHCYRHKKEGGWGVLTLLRASLSFPSLEAKKEADQPQVTSLYNDLVISKTQHTRLGSMAALVQLALTCTTVRSQAR